MRKLISSLLCLVLIFSITLNASASALNAIPDEDAVSVFSVPIDNVLPAQSSGIISPYGGYRLEFYDAAPGIVMIGSDNVIIDQGDIAKINVETLVWAPEHYNIQLGFWNVSTAEVYYKVLSGGSKNNVIYTYTGIPAGTYRVCVINAGSTSLTTGYMKYTVSFA